MAGFSKQIAILFRRPKGWILFDAPDGACDWLVSRGVDLNLLLLTHGHFDHIPDVAKIKRRFGCPIGCHPQTAPMISDPEFFRGFGFELEIEPVEPDFFIEETAAKKFLGLEMQVLEVPGHCPGSLCFFSPKDQLLIGGDVLFAGSVGRWDLSGGDADLLFDGIRKKIFPLGDDVTVLPGHGTTDQDRNGAKDESIHSLKTNHPFSARRTGRFASHYREINLPSSASSCCKPSIGSTMERNDFIAAGTYFRKCLWPFTRPRNP